MDEEEVVDSTDDGLGTVEGGEWKRSKVRLYPTGTESNSGRQKEPGVGEAVNASEEVGAADGETGEWDF
jgi:hypothetical protein